jgi:hypothetical protein
LQQVLIHAAIMALMTAQKHNEFGKLTSHRAKTLLR